MKKTVLLALTLTALGVASSKADVAFSISFGSRHHAPSYCAPPPVVYTPPVVYETVYAQPVYSRHVYVATSPVYHAPAPVYVPVPVYSRRVYAPVAAPAPCYTDRVYVPRHRGGWHH